MRIAVVRESTDEEDRRIPLIPAGAQKLVELGASIGVEAGIGLTIGFADRDYGDVGVEVVKDRRKLLESADMVLRLRKPSAEDVEGMKPGCVLVGFLDPFNERELLDRLAKARITSLCMELIPRTTLAQKMDALSSQANLAGYAAVIVAGAALDKIFPMMSTPAGTIPPARVFVVGAGVAGLQAVATAKRLGAIVEAFDTRPAVEEQVRSLGGRFVKIDVGETGETEQGYARELTEEQLARQREGMARHCEKSDVVITTAQVFGRRAPRIITEDMVARMKPGSVVVDLAVESGGNVAGAELGKVVVKNGVKIIGFAPLSARVALAASQMYSSNVVNLVAHFWDKEAKTFVLNPENEIIRGCLVTHDGEIRHELFRKEGV
jgi:H+-translocating NAD(P) transhydrogenase subunit alpha